MSEVLLQVSDLTMRFGGLLAVDQVAFDVRHDEVFAIIGPNGAGKTTVFNCVGGFYKPTSGNIVMDGKPITGMPSHKVAQQGLVRTFQNVRLFKNLTVLENLMVAQHNALMAASGYSLKGLFGLPGWTKAQKAATEKAKYWLDKVGLTDRADDPAGDLPYGAQRRLEIARAMCSEPILLCLDEPAAGLNPRESLELNTLLRAIRAEHGTSILLIEHDMSVVMEISDHVVVLDYGTKISDGTPRAVKDDPRVIAAYLGVDEDAVEEVEAELHIEHAATGAGA